MNINEPHDLKELFKFLSQVTDKRNLDFNINYFFSNGVMIKNKEFNIFIQYLDIKEIKETKNIVRIELNNLSYIELDFN
jgi:hypothetical protein